MRIANPEMFQVLMGHLAITMTPRQQEISRWWFHSGANPKALQVLGGERAGKSLLTSVLLAGSTDPLQKHTMWLVGPDYWQARPEFSYLLDMYEAAGLVKSTTMPDNNSQQWTMTLDSGFQVMTRSSYEKRKLASYKIHAAAMCEGGQQEQEVLTRLLGRLSETGGPLVISGTIEDGESWYEDLYIRWQGSNPLGARSWSLPTWSNIAVYPGGRDDPAIKILEAETPEDIFLERYAAVPRRKYGRVLPEFEMELHVRELQYDPTEGPVELAIDPGKHTYAVLFVQHVGLFTHVLDRVYKHNVIAEEIIPLAMANPLWAHIDLEAGGIIDIAGSHQPATLSQIEIWERDSGIKIRPGRYALQADTIEVLRARLTPRTIMGEPLIYFSQQITNQTSSDGQMAMDVLAEPYLWKWPVRAGQKNVAKYPVDKNNDAMKALAYKIVDRYGTVLRKTEKKKKKREDYWLAHSSMNRAVKRYAKQGTHTRQGRAVRGRTGRLY